MPGSAVLIALTVQAFAGSSGVSFTFSGSFTVA